MQQNTQKFTPELFDQIMIVSGMGSRSGGKMPKWALAARLHLVDGERKCDAARMAGIKSSGCYRGIDKINETLEEIKRISELAMIA